MWLLLAILIVYAVSNYTYVILPFILYFLFNLVPRAFPFYIFRREKPWERGCFLLTFSCGEFGEKTEKTVRFYRLRLGRFIEGRALIGWPSSEVTLTHKRKLTILRAIVG